MRMRKIVVQTAIFAAMTVLILGGPSLAWHWGEEENSVLLESRAGDPRIFDDGAWCLDETRTLENTTCAVLYAHNLFHPFKDHLKTMNLIRPPDCMEDLARGDPMDSSVFHSDSQAQVTIEMNPVSQGHEFDCDDAAIPHLGHPGDRAPVTLDPRVNITGYWYLSGDILQPPFVSLTEEHGPVPATGVLACVTVEMVLSSHSLDGVQELGRGTTTKTVVSGPTDEGFDAPTPACPGSEGPLVIEQVTEFPVDLGRESSTIDTGDTLQWHVAWYHGMPEGSDGSKIRPVQWSLHTGPDHPARLLLPVQDPFKTSNVQISSDSAHGFRFSWDLQSPWGNYDVDRENLRIVVHDDEGRKVDLDHARGLWFDDHGRDLLVIKGWNFPEERFPFGDYSITFASTNWQHTMDANITARMEVRQENVTILLDDGESLQAKRSLDQREVSGPGALSGIILMVFASALARVVSRRSPKQNPGRV